MMTLRPRVQTGNTVPRRKRAGKTWRLVSKAREGKAKVVLVTGKILTVTFAAISFYRSVWTGLFVIAVGVSLTNLYGKYRFRNLNSYTYD